MFILSFFFSSAVRDLIKIKKKKKRKKQQKICFLESYISQFLFFFRLFAFVLPFEWPLCCEPPPTPTPTPPKASCTSANGSEHIVQCNSFRYHLQVCPPNYPPPPIDCQLKLHCSNKHYYMMQIFSLICKSPWTGTKRVLCKSVEQAKAGEQIILIKLLTSRWGAHNITGERFNSNRRMLLNGLVFLCTVN